MSWGHDYAHGTLWLTPGARYAMTEAGAPLAVSGELLFESDLKFDQMTIKQVQFKFAFGEHDNYLFAAGAGSFGALVMKALKKDAGVEYWGNRSNIGKFVNGAAMARFGRRLSKEELIELSKVPTEWRLQQVQQAMLKGASPEEIYAATKIDPWFLHQIQEINTMTSMKLLPIHLYHWQ